MRLRCKILGQGQQSPRRKNKTGSNSNKTGSNSEKRGQDRDIKEVHIQINKHYKYKYH